MTTKVKDKEIFIVKFKTNKQKLWIIDNLDIYSITSENNKKENISLNVDKFLYE